MENFLIPDFCSCSNHDFSKNSNDCFSQKELNITLTKLKFQIRATL